MKTNKKINKLQKLLKAIIKDRIIRTTIAVRSHMLFFVIYFGDYMKYETARFQKEMFKLTEDKKNELLVISAFRNSGKSTIMTLSYPIWAILGKQKKKYVLILGKTQERAQEYLMNIRRTFEDNELLKNDLGPFQEERNQWGIKAITLQKFNARIAAGSIEQSIRGTRFNEHRPDLIIVDDVEDLEQVRSKENRDKIFQWFVSEIIPAKETGGKIVVVGSILHKDSFISRLKRAVLEGKTLGIYREYPIIDSDGNAQWPGKFPTAGDIEKERMTVMDERAWQTEYMLNPIENTDVIVPESWIQYYDRFPKHRTYDIKIGVDLAIGEGDNNDYTAMVSVRIYGRGRDALIYVLPNPINDRFNFPQTLETVKNLDRSFAKGEHPEFLVEDVAYQRAVIQAMEQENLPVKGIKIGGQSKRTRTVIASNWIKNCKILFPRKGAEKLIDQLTEFGISKYDDLVDALTIIVLFLMDEDKNYSNMPPIIILDDDIDGQIERWRKISRER
ncbi:MAG: hypothetical protein FJZ63_03975 [Chlamydiae bacterium]|nr:hypothetical protein [Chlamydiota bacterium]